MKLINKAFVDLDGQDIKQQLHPNVPPADDAPVLTVGMVLVNAALSTPAGPQPHAPEKAAKRFQLAIDLHKAKRDDEVDVPTDLIVDLKNDVCRLYGPIISGQFVGMIDATK